METAISNHHMDVWKSRYDARCLNAYQILRYRITSMSLIPLIPPFNWTVAVYIVCTPMQAMSWYSWQNKHNKCDDDENGARKNLHFKWSSSQFFLSVWLALCHRGGFSHLSRQANFNAEDFVSFFLMHFHGTCPNPLARLAPINFLAFHHFHKANWLSFWKSLILHRFLHSNYAVAMDWVVATNNPNWRRRQSLVTQTPFNWPALNWWLLMWPFTIDSMFLLRFGLDVSVSTESTWRTHSVHRMG